MITLWKPQYYSSQKHFDCWGPKFKNIKNKGIHRNLDIFLILTLQVPQKLRNLSP